MQRITSTLTTITDDNCSSWFVNHSLVFCPQMEMNYQVTEIEFDFDDDYDEGWENDPIPQQEIIDETIGTIWEADDEDDLIEEITTATGWCIKSIDYRHILN